MDWKKRLTELKVGDKVRIIKACHCSGWDSCKLRYKEICEIYRIDKDEPDNRIYGVAINWNSPEYPNTRVDWCRFSKEQLEKV